MTLFFQVIRPEKYSRQLCFWAVELKKEKEKGEGEKAFNKYSYLYISTGLFVTCENPR